MSRFNNLPRNLKEVYQESRCCLPTYEGKRFNLACVNEFLVRLCCVRIKWNYRGLVVYHLLGVGGGGGLRPFWETLEDFQTEPPLWLHPNFLKMTSINFTCCERDPYPNILARNWAEVHQMLNIYSSVKRSVFYIIHSFCHRSLHERSFCTIGNTTDYSFCMLNVVL